MCIDHTTGLGDINYLERFSVEDLWPSSDPYPPFLRMLDDCVAFR